MTEQPDNWQPTTEPLTEGQLTLLPDRARYAAIGAHSLIRTLEEQMTEGERTRPAYFSALGDARLMLYLCRLLVEEIEQREDAERERDAERASTVKSVGVIVTKLSEVERKVQSLIDERDRLRVALGREGTK